MANGMTPHYGLNQWAKDDQFVRTEFNADNEKVDAALHGLAGAVAEKAAQAALDGLTAVVGTKAAQADLAALTKTVNTKAAQSALDSLAATVGTKAAQSALDSLTATVNTKASQSDLNALTKTVGTKAAQTALNSLSSTVSDLTATVNTKASQAALNALRSDMTAGDLWVKLVDVTTTAAATTIDVDLSRTNFFDYMEIRVYFYAPSCGQNIYVRLNGDATQNSYTINAEGSGNYADFLTFFTSNGNQPVFGRFTSLWIAPGLYPLFQCLCLNAAASGINNYAHYNRSTWDTLTSIRFTSEAAISAGAKVRIIGLRK